jgi:glycosyltransferase involved in cell wall biosynthesis
VRLCVVSFKPCWQDGTGQWKSEGGFPLQMRAVSSLFDSATLVVVRVPARDGGLSLPAGATVIGLRSPSGSDTARKFSMLAGLAYYVKAITAEVRKADVVHVPVPGDISFLGLMLALVFRKRLIARYGSSWAPTAQTTLTQRVTKRCMRMCAGGRNVMLATGIGAVPPAPRMRWIFSTALTKAEMGSIRPTFDRGLGHPPRLVYIGRLSPEKGVAYLLRALARLDRAAVQPIPQLTLIGDGPERQRLEDQTRELGIAHLVTFAGYVDRASLSALLYDADLCVQPSLTEGFSKAWLDALAHGVPVLSSRVGAAPAVIGKSGQCGWLVPPGDELALAEALRAALSQGHEWPALRRRCRAAAEGWTLEAWAEEIGGICAEHWGGVVAAGKLRI